MSTQTNRPSSGQHCTSIRVRYGDTDKSGAVYHANYVRWFEAGRVEAMRAAGIPYVELEAAGISLPVIELLVRYHRPVQYDELVEVWTRIAELTRTRARFEYTLLRAEEESPLAFGYTVHPFVDGSGRVQRMDRHPELWQRIQEAVESLGAAG